MGDRITIDSATLMNKGFEVIEARWLFDFAPEAIEVVVHPQSSVHAMVEYEDGSVIAQVSATDMRMPIQYALTWPDRAAAPVPRIDWAQSRQWEFHAPDFDKFPLLGLAYESLHRGGTSVLYSERCRRNRGGGVSWKETAVSGNCASGGRDFEPDAISGTCPSVAEILETDGDARRKAQEVIETNAICSVRRMWRIRAAEPVEEQTRNDYASVETYGGCWS